MTSSLDTLGFHHPAWQDCIEDAKRVCYVAHALHNLFPFKCCDLDSLITESLIMVMVEWTNRDTGLQPGIFYIWLPGPMEANFPFHAQASGQNTREILQQW